VTKEVPAGLSRRSEVFNLVFLLAVGKAVVILAVYLLEPSATIIRVMGTHWDSNYYEIIATQGYGPTAPYVFSPVYPAFIATFDLFIHNAWVSALIITNSLSFVFPLLLYRSFGYRTALLAELFPTYLVFTTVAYSDVVALVFLGALVYLIMCNRTTGSSVFLGAAVLTFFNLAWTLPSFAVALMRGRFSRAILFYAAPLVVGLSIMLWFKAETGLFVPLIKLEAPWDVGFGTPLQQADYLLCTSGTGSFTCQGWNVFGVALTPGYWFLRNLLFESFYLFGAFYLLLRTTLRYRVFLFVYCISVIVPLLFMVGTPALSIPRLLLPAFPVFIGYSEFLRKRLNAFPVYVVVCFVLAGLISIIEYFSLFA
jgi:hypothetical protein